MTMRLNDMKPASGRPQDAPARGTRRFRRPGQDLRPRREGPARAQGRLPQGRLRRRPDAAFSAACRRSASARRWNMAEVRLDELAKVEGTVIDLDALKKANIIPTFADRAKVVLSGEIKKAVSLKGIGATKGAKEAIEKAGGTVEALPEPPKPSKLAQEAGLRTRTGKSTWQTAPPESGSSTRRRGAFRRRAQSPAVPDRRPDRLPHRHLHPGAGHRPGARGELLQGQRRDHLRHRQHVLRRRAVSACPSSPWA